MIGESVTVRIASRLVKVIFRGQVVIYPRQAPGCRPTDETDLPSEVTVDTMRNRDKVQAMAARHGAAIGAYATALLDIPLPWTKMRQVYRLLNLVKKLRPTRSTKPVCGALECEAIDVGLIARIVARAAETDPPPPDRNVVSAANRFARDPGEFAVVREASL